MATMQQKEHTFLINVLIPAAKNALSSTKKNDRNNNKVKHKNSIILGNATANALGSKGFPEPPYGQMGKGRGLCLKEPDEKGKLRKEELAFWSASKSFVEKYHSDWCPVDKEGRPRFMVQVGETKKVEKHKDSQDMTTQLAISFGEFTGGRLVVEKNGEEEFHDTKNKVVEVDARNLHYVEAFTGKRYSLIFFTNWSGWEEALDNNKKRKGPRHKKITKQRKKAKQARAAGFIELGPHGVIQAPSNGTWTCLVDSIHWLLPGKLWRTLVLLLYDRNIVGLTFCFPSLFYKSA
jgi:hypothetical protein